MTWDNLCNVPSTQKIFNWKWVLFLCVRDVPLGFWAYCSWDWWNGGCCYLCTVELSVNYSLSSWNRCLLKSNTEVANTTCLVYFSAQGSDLGSPGRDCKRSPCHGWMRSRILKEASFRICGMKKWSPFHWFIHSFQHLFCAGPWVRFRGGQGMDPLMESPLLGETDWYTDIYRTCAHKQQWVFLYGGMVTQSMCALFWWEKTLRK